MRLASALDTEESKEIEKWLEQYIFPEDFLEDNYFDVNKVLYSVDLRGHFTTIHSIIHNCHPAKFSREDLNMALLKGCRTIGLDKRCNYFNVNVHDNVSRIVESIGGYNLDSQEDKRLLLFPLYFLLTENRAEEGGTSYTGLIGKAKDWMLSIEYELDIIIKIHGNQDFCDLVESYLLS